MIVITVLNVKYYCDQIIRIDDFLYLYIFNAEVKAFEYINVLSINEVWNIKIK